MFILCCTGLNEAWKEEALRQEERETTHNPTAAGRDEPIGNLLPLTSSAADPRTTTHPRTTTGPRTATGPRTTTHPRTTTPRAPAGLEESSEEGG